MCCPSVRARTARAPRHRAAPRRRRPPDAGERAGECRLARGRRPGDARRLPRLEAERGAPHRRYPCAGSHDREALRLQDRAGCRQRSAGLLRRRLLQKLRQRTPRSPHALQLGPLCHRLIDRRERPAQQDRGRDHHPKTRLAVDREPGTQPQHHRLEEEAQRLRGHHGRTRPDRRQRASDRAFRP